MKILYILPILLFCKISLAQDIPVIPMKNDLVFYEFTHTLKNTRQCLSKYWFNTQLKVSTKVRAKQSTIKNFPGYSFSFSMPNGLKRGGPHTLVNCQDTVVSDIGRPLFKKTIPVNQNLLSNNPLFHILKAKLVSQEITALVEIVFVSKNEYILKFKDFQYNVMSSKSYQSPITEQVPLGEVYNNFLSIEKKSKDQIELFNALNLYLNSIDEIFLEALTELYQADEL